jgi:UDP-N-acetylglucosamine 2-epimerase (non-hydrolysing)
MKKRVLIVAGARPNFVKIAPIMREFKKHKRHFEVFLVHTGQHYDFGMSDVFFQNLRIPSPDIYLGVGSASHSIQTAKIMVAFENTVLLQKPDLVIVVGDVNSTLACSLVASKLGVKSAHVEAGLRSFDREMPEEINRMITDSLSDYLFVSERSGLQNLKREGINSEKVHFVGNVMIDTLSANLHIIDRSDILSKLRLTENEYSVLTLHRPSNVDSREALTEVFDILTSISREIRIVYPIHPRTKKMIKEHKFLSKFKKLDNLLITDPLGYIDFVKLIKESKFVITDSGGIQEESTFLKVPCLTMRENTERPITIEKGTNYLVGRDKRKILNCVKKILNGISKKGSIPELWDGKTAERIIKIL